MEQLNVGREIALPLIILGGFAWIIPTLLARVLPHSMVWLAGNFAISATLLILLCGAYMYWTWDLTERDAMIGLDTNLLVFISAVVRARLAALVWLPILVLALVVQPQKWRPEL